MMKQKKAFISGISGQDGSYLVELLLEKGYEVHGIVRRHSVAENQDRRLQGFGDKVTRYYSDLLDPHSLYRIFRDVKPDEIYHLGAQSHVRISSDIPSYTIKTNVDGTLNMLEAFKEIVPKSRFYFAGSSEQFGNNIDKDGFQRELTPMDPVSPYGCSKVMGYNLTRHYRKAYGLHASCGILFNHESERRGINFVTNKVARGAVEIKKGLKKELYLGNLESYRDWSHAKDMVRGMWMILNHDTPDDFVLSSGQTHSVRDLCNLVFLELGMDYQDYVKINQKYLRPEELKYLKGDCSKAKSVLGWKPEYTFKKMMKEMIDYWMKTL